MSDFPMSSFPTEVLSSDRITALEQEVIQEAETGHKETAWNKVQPLRKSQHHQREAASALLRIVDRRCLPREGAADILLEIAQSHAQDAGLLAIVGQCLEAACDIDDLNASPPAHAVFQIVLERLVTLAQDQAGRPDEE